MAGSFRQMAYSRRTRRITQQELADRMGCSLQWVRVLELTNYIQTPTAEKWLEKYATALQAIIAERQQAKVK